jgi:hypothetical protein
MSAAYPWRGRWDTVGLLLRQTKHSERGNHLAWDSGRVGIQPSVRDRRTDRRTGGVGRSRRSTPSQGEPVHMGKGGSGIEKGWRL